MSAYAKAMAQQSSRSSPTRAKTGGKRITLPLVHPKYVLILEFCLYALGFGGKGIRTPDFQLAKLALYQLSYAPGEVLILDCRLPIANFAAKQACRYA